MKHKGEIIGIILVLILLIFDAFIQIQHILNFEKQKQDGNNKWHIVENRIIEIEEKVNDINKGE